MPERFRVVGVDAAGVRTIKLDNVSRKVAEEAKRLLEVGGMFREVLIEPAEQAPDADS